MRYLENNNKRRTFLQSVHEWNLTRDKSRSTNDNWSWSCHLDPTSRLQWLLWNLMQSGRWRATKRFPWRMVLEDQTNEEKYSRWRWDTRPVCTVSVHTNSFVCWSSFQSWQGFPLQVNKVIRCIYVHEGQICLWRSRNLGKLIRRHPHMKVCIDLLVILASAAASHSFPSCSFCFTPQSSEGRFYVLLNNAIWTWNWSYITPILLWLIEQSSSLPRCDRNKNKGTCSMHCNEHDSNQLEHQ